MAADRLTTDQLRQLVIDYSAGCGLNPNIALAQIERESAHFRPDVVYGPFVGAAGEKGMAQFILGTWARFGIGPHDNAYDPNYAMNAYCRYMQYLLALFGGDYEKALQGYNGGEGNVQRGTVSLRAQTYAREILAQAGSGSGSGSDSALDAEATLDAETAKGAPLWLLIGGLFLMGWILLDD